jgi:hypothetical protein
MDLNRFQILTKIRSRPHQVLLGLGRATSGSCDPVLSTLHDRPWHELVGIGPSDHENSTPNVIFERTVEHTGFVGVWCRQERDALPCYRRRDHLVCFLDRDWTMIYINYLGWTTIPFAFPPPTKTTNA